MNSALQRMLRPAGRENNWRSPSMHSAVFPGPFVLPSLNKLMSLVASGLFGVCQEFVTVIRQSRREQNRDLGNVYKVFTNYGNRRDNVSSPNAAI
jgi:hypothetical protein